MSRPDAWEEAWEREHAALEELERALEVFLAGGLVRRLRRVLNMARKVRREREAARVECARLQRALAAEGEASSNQADRIAALRRENAALRARLEAAEAALAALDRDALTAEVSARVLERLAPGVCGEGTVAPPGTPAP